jgi:choline-sulfatase
VTENQPNILFIMTDQQRADVLRAGGNLDVFTPNMDRLARRGVRFARAYSTCPVCVPARYTIRTGREPHTTAVYANGAPAPVDGQAASMEERCGPYLARTLARLGYRTFGIGKFHTQPRDEDLGYEAHLHSEELFSTPEHRKLDAYSTFIEREHPAFTHVEDYMGERSEMYYVPQQSPLPPDITVESWAADRAVEQIQSSDARPYFGFVSFIGPHPPLAPPVPYNRMYNPDRMPNPIRGDISVDHMDEQIPWMNYAVWAEDINDSLARVLRARYYGEISYIDQCLGRILDAVESRSDADTTLICFYSDHGDHLGDHHGWQKESFFDVSCRVPFLLSWPNQVEANAESNNLVCLTDLFGIATTAAGAPELRDGADVLNALWGKSKPRERVVGLHGMPGTPRFKVMVREGDCKYIFFANGGGEQLFNLADDPYELHQRIHDAPDVARSLRAAALDAIDVPNANRALDGGNFKIFPYEARPLKRIVQFDASRGVTGFPENPGDLFAGS